MTEERAGPLLQSVHSPTPTFVSIHFGAGRQEYKGASRTGDVGATSLPARAASESYSDTTDLVKRLNYDPLFERHGRIGQTLGGGVGATTIALSLAYQAALPLPTHRVYGRNDASAVKWPKQAVV